MAAKKIVLSAGRARRILALTIAALTLTACAAPPTPTRIALLAPFEGRYREVGYDALYAARLALQESGAKQIELLPVDDGGTAASAADRARALTYDPQIQSALLLGYAATDPDTLSALANLPALVVGSWGAQPVSERIFSLSNPTIVDELTLHSRIAITEAAALDGLLTGGDVLALTQFPRLRADLDDVRVMTSAALPDVAFTERYRSSDSFAPEPGLLASLTYDATNMLIQALQRASGREAVYTILSGSTYEGINGPIRFEQGYWANAPLYTYAYDASGQLTPVDNPTE